MQLREAAATRGSRERNLGWEGGRHHQLGVTRVKTQLIQRLEAARLRPCTSRSTSSASAEERAKAGIGTWRRQSAARSWSRELDLVVRGEDSKMDATS